LIFRSLGEDDFERFTAITALASVLGPLSLGVGGAIVNPVSTAQIRQDRETELAYVGSAIIPLLIMTVAAGLIGGTFVLFAPLAMILGAGAVGADESPVRTAALAAAIGISLRLGSTIVGGLRQAYSELHISNLVGAVSNLVLAALLFLGWREGVGLVTFVVITTFVPTATTLTSGVLILLKRPYLLLAPRHWQYRLSKQIVGTGLLFVGVGVAPFLMLQWPTIYVLRHSDGREGVMFSILMNFLMLVTSVAVTTINPLWTPVAEARERGDIQWIRLVVRRGQLTVGVIGISGAAAMYHLGGRGCRAWVGSECDISAFAFALSAAYWTVHAFEYLQFITLQGLGAQRWSSAILFGRALIFAASVPFVAHLGVSVILGAMCLATCISSLWLLPERIWRQIGRGLA
jgi:O-antigen/teichoic acid export membrane protein